MRIYDSCEDLPPTDIYVWCLIELADEYGRENIQHLARFNPSEGWVSKNGTRVKVLKWCDCIIPDLEQPTPLQEKPQTFIKRSKKNERRM